MFKSPIAEAFESGLKLFGQFWDEWIGDLFTERIADDAKEEQV